MVAVNAAPSAPSSFVGDTPVRILDTRTDVGLSGPFVSGEAQTLQVTGTVPTQPPNSALAANAVAVPATATSVVFNVTVVNPTTDGFLSIRPGDATGTPATSNINWAAGGANIANAVTVQLPANGTINLFVSGTVGEVLIDVAGYYIPGGTGATGPAGPTGGVDYATSNINIPLTNPGITDLQSLDVTVPEDGFLLVTATAQIVGATGTSVACSVGTTPLTQGPIVTGVQFQGGTFITNFALTGGIPVSAGTVTLYHNCRQDNGADGDAIAQQTAMTVVFSASRL